MRFRLLLLCAISALLFSCQKEITYNSPNSGSGGSAGNGGSGGSGGSGAGTGELLVKAVQITPSTGDTNTVTFQWDASRRLLNYKSHGMVSGVVTDIDYNITRDGSGKITKIVYITSLPSSSSDSTVYTVHYKPNSNQLSYVTAVQNNAIWGVINDSALYTYNSSGQITQREVYSDLFLTMMPFSKQTYTYDGNGNVTLISDFSTNMLGGYTPSATTTNTYNGHKAAVSLGEETFIVLSATNCSRNEMTQMVTNAVSSGTTYTTTMTQQQYNSFDRPTSATLNVLPQPPGYTNKLIYYYQ